MHPVVVHLASGQAFFSGMAAVLVAILVTFRPWRSFRSSTDSTSPARRVRNLPALLSLIGLFLVILSGTPTPMPLLVLWGLSFCGWLLVLVWPVRPDRPRHRLERIIPGILLGVSLLAAAWELPYRFSPTLTPVRERGFTLIADSLSAGLGEKEATTWPKLLERRHGLKVEDWSRQGETVASALKRAPAEGVTTPLVVLEIGGNDLLGPTTDTAFESGLDALLTFARKGDDRGDRQLVMFELPLPPFRQNVGAIQRRLARKHNVRLIPKSVLLGVVAGADATVDGLHLSQSGHERMAAEVWSIIGPAFGPDAPPVASVAGRRRSETNPLRQP